MKLHDLQVGQRFTFTDKHLGKVFEIVETGRQTIAFRDVATNEVRITDSNRKTFRMEVELVAEDKFAPFNLNEYIKVKLYDAGYQRLADLHNQYVGVIPSFEIRTSEFYKQQADKDGYTTFQAWSFIQDFGETVRIGVDHIFDINILVELTGLPGRRVVLPEGE